MVEQRIGVEPYFKRECDQQGHTKQSNDDGFIECRYYQFKRVEPQCRGNVQITVAVVDRMHAPEQRATMHVKMLQPDREIKDYKGKSGLNPKGQGDQIQHAKLVRIGPICGHADHHQKGQQSARNCVADEEQCMCSPSWASAQHQRTARPDRLGACEQDKQQGGDSYRIVAKPRQYHVRYASACSRKG